MTPPNWSSLKKAIYAAVDSAASGNYFTATYHSEQPDSGVQGLLVGTANDNIMQSVGTDRFVLPGLPSPARACHKFLKVSLPLVLVGTLCIHGMLVLFDKHNVTVFNKLGTIVTQGHKDPNRNLYMILIDTATNAQPRVLEPSPGIEEPPRTLPPASCSPSTNAHIQCWAANAYKICLVLALISYLHAVAVGSQRKHYWLGLRLATIAFGLVLLLQGCADI